MNVMLRRQVGVAMLVQAQLMLPQTSSERGREGRKRPTPISTGTLVLAFCAVAVVAAMTVTDS